MHRFISEIIELEVVGEIVPDGDGFADTGLGRVCLGSVETEAVAQMASRLRQKIDGSVEVIREIESDSTAAVRGLAEIHIRRTGDREAYVLQIANPRAIAFYEQRFWLGPDLLGDVMATYVNGLRVHRHLASRTVLGALIDIEELQRQYQEALDRALRIEAEAEVATLARSLQNAWRLLPWKARLDIQTLWHPAPARAFSPGSYIAQVLVFCMTQSDGGLAYHHLHRQNPYQEPDEIESWMKQTHKALIGSYPAPQHTTIAAHASSVARFLEHFPRYRPVVGSNPAEEAPGE